MGHFSPTQGGACSGAVFRWVLTIHLTLLGVKSAYHAVTPAMLRRFRICLVMNVIKSKEIASPCGINNIVESTV